MHGKVDWSLSVIPAASELCVCGRLCLYDDQQLLLLTGNCAVLL